MAPSNHRTTFLLEADGVTVVNDPQGNPVTAVTGADGLATVPAHTAGQAGTIVTVAADDYDLWTFHRVTSRTFDVPLQRSVGSPP